MLHTGCNGDGITCTAEGLRPRPGIIEIPATHLPDTMSHSQISISGAVPSMVRLIYFLATGLLNMRPAYHSVSLCMGPGSESCLAIFLAFLSMLLLLQSSLPGFILELLHLHLHQHLTGKDQVAHLQAKRDL